MARLTDPTCRHARRAIACTEVTSPGQAHAATDVCLRMSCMADALFWVNSTTMSQRGYIHPNHGLAMPVESLVDGRVYKMASPEMVLGMWRDGLAGKHFVGRQYVSGGWHLIIRHHGDSGSEGGFPPIWPLEMIEETVSNETLSASIRELEELEIKYGLRVQL